MNYNLQRTVLNPEDIQNMVSRVANEINQATGDEPLVVIGVMKGAYIWMADLLRAMNREDVIMDYIDVSSYVGDSSTGHITIQRDLKTDLAGKNVLILDEVVDTGLTLRYLKADFKQRGAKNVWIAVATDKRENEDDGEVTVDFVGAHVPNEFLVGYGMDYNEHFRNMDSVKVLELLDD
ncbi:hypoxanthine phosphoribosyltransferase [Weissella uvarum]|uniref:hypoxanthine phosphoribosyltransferase n=1 Tax=Weissella uvarum TaxID=1479233 RepID=UPI0019611BDB|nr:hypoxanthine phosphoribosyltransferase [Weissella uvarum]MBM7617711.1 hypoxanthine phosphoribosyltransferase [Weissella uvarum]MCM0596060.1 hypoxanthine phosphoribosyltransferase [Weissella uvarum]